MKTTDDIVTESIERTDYAVTQWEKAPYHVKSIAGAYMVPVLEALKAQQDAISALLQESFANGKT